MKNILITGAAGYLGSHTAAALLEAGHRVVGVDNLENSHPEALRRAGRLAGATIPLHVTDVRDTGRISELLEAEAIDTVMHFAGVKSVAESMLDPLRYFSANTAGAISLLTAMQTVGVARLVFSSSCTVYGEQQLAVGTGERLPVSPYGRSKAMVEDILSDVAAAHSSFESMSLRYFNPAGAHPSGCIGETSRGRPTNLMPLVMNAAAGGSSPLIIHGDDYDTPDGTCVRDYVHVQDLAAAHVAAVDNLAIGARAFNLGTGIGVSVQELVDTARRVTGRSIPTLIGDRRAGDVASAVAAVGDTTAALGWKAELDLEQMCEDHWRWLITNPQGYGG